MTIDLSLERIAALLDHLPRYTRPTIHITGTNGKGSVAALTASILQASGLTVGRFNSPHLLEPYDCIAINDEAISPDIFTDEQAEIRRTDALHGTHVSSFEILTLTAFMIFEKRGVDVAVVECGMGGKRDATNVLPDEVILVSAMTAVDLDHQAFLGNTPEEIASDKVGIYRRGRPFVLGSQKHAGVETAVRSVVNEDDLVLASPVPSNDDQTEEVVDEAVESPLQCVQVSVGLHPPFLAKLPLQGEHQLQNLGIAISVISCLTTRSSIIASTRGWANQITPETIARGIRETRWPGRLSFHTYCTPANQVLSVLVDGAHNPASSATLANYIAKLAGGPRPMSSITFIFALSSSPPKTPHQTLAPIFQHPDIQAIKRVRVVPLTFTPPQDMPWVKTVARSALHETVQTLAPYAELPSAVPADDQDQPFMGEAGLVSGLAWAANEDPDGMVVIAGSLYLVADFYRLIGGRSAISR